MPRSTLSKEPAATAAVQQRIQAHERNAAYRMAITPVVAIALVTVYATAPWGTLSCGAWLLEMLPGAAWQALSFLMNQGVVAFCLLSWTLLQWMQGVRLKAVLLALTQKGATLPSPEDLALLQARTTVHAKVWSIGFCLAIGTMVCLSIYAGGVLVEASKATPEQVAGLRPALSALVLWLVFGFVLSDELRFKEKASWVPAKSLLGERKGGALVSLARAVEEATKQAHGEELCKKITDTSLAGLNPLEKSSQHPSSATQPEPLYQKDFRP